MMGRKASPAWKVRLDQKVPKDKLVIPFLNLYPDILFCGYISSSSCFFFKYIKAQKETLDLLGHPDLPVHLESCLYCLLNCFSNETVQLAARNATRKAQKIYRMTVILEPLGIS